MVTSGQFCGPEAFGYPRPGIHDTHLSIAVIVEEGNEGLEYLVFEYDSGDGVQIKFPAGTNKSRPNESAAQTLFREVKEETGLILPSSTRWIWSGPRTPNSHGELGSHQKIAFVASFKDCRGEIRTFPMVDDDGNRLSPPFWRTYEELIVPAEEGGLFYTHRHALEEAKKKYLS